MKIRKELLKRELCGETFLVPLGKSVYDSNGLFALSELAAFIWDMLPEAENEEEILKQILTEYDVQEETAREDLSVFLNDLRKLGIL